MVRLMYGGRTSIYVGLAAAAFTTLVGVVVGLLAGFYRGWLDAVLTRILDVIWAFPVLLLGIALGTALAVGGLELGFISIAGDSIWIPILIIGVVYVPYMARPIRGEILALREKEFVEAAVAQGMSPLRIMFSELLPNVISTIIVFFSRSTSPTTCCWSRRCRFWGGRCAATQCVVGGHDDRRRLRHDLHRTASHCGSRADDHRDGVVAERVR